VYGLVKIIDKTSIAREVHRKILKLLENTAYGGK